MADSIGDKVKEFFGFGEVESYEDPYYRDSFEERSPRQDLATEREAPREPSRGSYGRYRGSDYGAGYGIESAERTPERPIGSAPVTKPVAKKEPIAVRLSLSDYNQAKELADTLKGGDVVVFNLGGMEKSVATRVLDFAAGLSLGLDAKLEKLRGLRNFVLIPQGVTLDQSQLDQLAEG